MKQLFFTTICALMLMVSTAFAAVNINTASASEIASLKGIGPAKAAAIVKFRDQHGPYTSISDLQQVKGIGPKILEKIRSDVTINN